MTDETPAVVEVKRSKEEIEKDLAEITKEIKALHVVPKPDETKLKKEQEKLKKKMDAYKQEMEALKEKIEKQIGPKKAEGEEKAPKPVGPGAEIREKLKGLQKKLKDAFDENKALRAVIDGCDEKRKATLDALKKAREANPHSSGEQVDREIARLEDHLGSGAVKSLKEEKDIVSKINSLKQSKKTLGDQAAMNASLGVLDEKKKAAHTSLKANSELINKLKDEEKVQREALDKINEVQKANKTDVSSLIKRRDDLRKEMNALYEEQKKFYADKEKLYEEWKANSNAHYKLTKREKHLNWELRSLTLPADAVEGEDGEVATPSSPWVQEITVCNDLIAHLTRLTTTHLSVPEEKVEKKFELKLDPKDKVIGRHAGDEGNYLSLGKPKAEKKKPAAPANPSATKLSHSIDTLVWFSTIDVVAPTTVGDIAAALEAVKAKKAHFETNPPKEDKKKDEASSPKKNSKEAKGKEPKTADTVAHVPKVVEATSAPTGAWASKRK